MKLPKTAPVYIKPASGVNPDMMNDARRLENDPEFIMKLVDWIFLMKDETKDIPS